MTKLFDFKTEMMKGKRGEEVFLACFPEWRINNSTDCKAPDFINDKGETLELKTDYTKYSNIFCEELSDMDTGKIGGPWRALEENVKYFAYMFYNKGCMYIFNTKDLVEYLNNHKSRFSPKFIHNRGWTAKGYAIPISQLQHLVIHQYYNISLVKKDIPVAIHME